MFVFNSIELKSNLKQNPSVTKSMEPARIRRSENKLIYIFYDVHPFSQRFKNICPFLTKNFNNIRTSYFPIYLKYLIFN
jgi:hypothetical protein